MERLKRMDEVVCNFKNNKVAEPIDLSDFDDLSVGAELNSEGNGR